jgi:hypothetical protein
VAFKRYNRRLIVNYVYHLSHPVLFPCLYLLHRYRERSVVFTKPVDGCVFEYYESAIVVCETVPKMIPHSVISSTLGFI